jgi:PPM family protein phosphatase
MYISIRLIKTIGLVALIIIIVAIIICVIYRLSKRKKKTILIGNSQEKGSRKVQEDSFSSIESENGMIAIVADGMGGLEYGKIASSTAVKMFIEEFAKEYEMYDVEKFLINTTYTANENIVNMANGRKIGTTVVATVIKDDILHWISVGDSRIYLHRKGELIKLNKEHTYERVLNDRYESGEISRNDVQKHPQKEFLTSYIGYDEFHEIEYSKKPIQLIKGDKVILMSDGIYKSISEEELKEILQKKNNPDKVCDIITDKIEKKRIVNQDNMTIIMMEKY